MSSDSSSRRFSEFDFDRLLRIGGKLFGILQKKCRNVEDAYMVVVLMVLFFEECEGCRLDAEGWNKLRSVVAEAWKEEG